MSAYLTTFVDGVRTAITAGWPEVLPAAGGGGVYRFGQIARMSLKGQFDALALPYAVIRIPELSNGDEWGADQDAYVCWVECYLVREDPEDFDTLDARMETFRDYIQDNGLAAGEVLTGRRISDDVFNPMNQILISKQIPAVAGMVAFQVVIGEGD